MRKASVVILSAVACGGFACTGVEDGKGGNAAETGGTAGSGSGAAGAGGGNGGSGRAGNGGAPGVTRVLVFSRTAGFRHDSIADGVNALSTIAEERGWELLATEDQNIFSDAGLEPFNVVVFLSTTGDVLGAAEESALERYVRAGGGWVGIHSASDTEYDWPFYGGLVGAYFREHPAVQEAVVRVEDATHPSTSALPASFERTDEWYAFRENPRPNVTVLLTLDETTYSPGTASMGTDHPIAWSHVYESGRAFYTALGHTRESYAEPAFLSHIAGAVQWAAGR